MTQRILVFGLCLVVFGADIKVVAPPGATVVGPYSPGLETADFLYVSGQGAANAQKKFAATTEEQVADTLANIRAIVEAAGLTMEHVVYTQVYVHDAGAFDAVERAWRKAFPKMGPARSLLGVHRMPTETPVEISAVAVKNLGSKKAVP